MRGNINRNQLYQCGKISSHLSFHFLSLYNVNCFHNEKIEAVKIKPFTSATVGKLRAK